jgi:predicted HicB family RNase H-like nuclease
MAQKSSKAKAKPKAASRSAKPAKAAAHKKSASAARKPAARKAPAAKHTTKAMSSSKKAGDFDDFSGKFTVRLPKSLHQALVDRAEREGVSLNLFVTNALSRTVK